MRDQARFDRDYAKKWSLTTQISMAVARIMATNDRDVTELTRAGIPLEGGGPGRRKRNEKVLGTGLKARWTDQIRFRTAPIINFRANSLVPQGRIELPTSPLPRVRSTTELLRHCGG